MSDATFREALEAYKVAIQDVERTHLLGQMDSPTMVIRKDRARAAESRVLALYAVAAVGEIGEAIRVTRAAQIGMYEMLVVVDGTNWPEEGDSVRIVVEHE